MGETEGMKILGKTELISISRRRGLVSRTHISLPCSELTNGPH